jgi:16S rRNA (cytosine967-C5)-methyltransferase
VQDVSAALPASLFSNIKGKRVFDLCAAPGGKTAQLISMGAHVIALDISKNRMVRLQENLSRLQLTAELITIDVAMWQPAELADAILLDAPCSATGTLRRNPDVAWIKREADIERLIATQRKLLKKAVDLLKSGSELVYCVCSLERAEGEAQIEWLLNEEPRVKLALETHPPIAPETVCNVGFRLLPTDLADQGGMDGFFMTKLRKI